MSLWIKWRNMDYYKDVHLQINKFKFLPMAFPSSLVDPVKILKNKMRRRKVTQNSINNSIVYVCVLSCNCSAPVHSHHYALGAGLPHRLLDMSHLTLVWTSNQSTCGRPIMLFCSIWNSVGAHTAINTPDRTRRPPARAIKCSQTMAYLSLEAWIHLPLMESLLYCLPGLGPHRRCSASSLLFQSTEPTPADWYTSESRRGEKTVGYKETGKKC